MVPFTNSKMAANVVKQDESKEKIEPIMLKRKIVILPPPEPLSDFPSIIEIARKRTPLKWAKVFKVMDRELQDISDIVENYEKRNNTMTFPAREDIFRAFHLTAPEDISVCLIAMDPYHQLLSSGKPRAQGYAFGISPTDTIPSSLSNIYKELNNSLPDFKIPKHGNLISWTKNVFLLNACLTVAKDKAGSHKKIWIPFIQRVLAEIAVANPKCIFLLWGAEAKKLTEYIGKNSIVLTAAHPSGFSAHRGFFGCNHFALANKHLIEAGRKPIDWQIPA
jgi:uracil-DNA glycosylase